MLNMSSVMQLNAITSMLIVSLPFPPLPVVCIRASDAGDSHASGHDLLSAAIASMLVDTGDKLGFDSTEVLERKQSIVLSLNDEISESWHARDKKCEGVALEECYAIFCQAFRQYMGCYPGCSDLRIKGMDAVCPSDVIVEQAVAHLTAMAATFVEADSQGPGACDAPLPSTKCYQDIIRMYVLGMCSVSRREGGRQLE